MKEVREEFEYVSQTTGKRGKQWATIVACPACGGMTFVIFRVDGQTHDHLQCAACRESFCNGEQCSHDPETN